MLYANTVSPYTLTYSSASWEGPESGSEGLFSMEPKFTNFSTDNKPNFDEGGLVVFSGTQTTPALLRQYNIPQHCTGSTTTININGIDFLKTEIVEYYQSLGEDYGDSVYYSTICLFSDSPFVRIKFDFSVPSSRPDPNKEKIARYWKEEAWKAMQTFRWQGEKGAAPMGQ